MFKITDNDRNLWDFGGKIAQTYSATCDCGATIEVSAGRREDAEYDVLIFVKCQLCGASVGLWVVN